MHAAFFGIKNLRVLAVSRALLADVGLTPARFDMLRIVELHADGIPQRNIQYLLGVSAPTVCRMLQALEKLGLLHRERSERDRRCVFVSLTRLGRDLVTFALDELIDTGIAERFALRGLGTNPEVARNDLSTLQSFLARMRKTFGDWPLFEHPWRIGCLEDDDGWPYLAKVVDGEVTLVSAFN